MYVCMWIKKKVCVRERANEWVNDEWLNVCVCIFLLFLSYAFAVCLCLRVSVCVCVYLYKTVLRLVRTLYYTVRMHRMKSCLETAIWTNAYSILFTCTHTHTHTYKYIHTNVHIERHSSKSPHAKQIAKNIIIDSKIILLILI